MAKDGEMRARRVRADATPLRRVNEEEEEDHDNDDDDDDDDDDDNGMVLREEATSLHVRVDEIVTSAFAVVEKDAEALAKARDD